MSPHRLTSALLALTMLLASPVAAATQGAILAVTDQPAPPGQPSTGPGGAEYIFPGVRITALGDVPGGGHLFEPTTEAGRGTPVATGPLPLVLLIDGCC